MVNPTKKAPGKPTEADGASPPSFDADVWTSLEAKMTKELDAYVTKSFNQLNNKSINNKAERAIHIASKEGHLLLLDSLLRHGVKTDVTNVDNQTPLHLAIENGQEKVAIKLIEKRQISLSITDKKGRSPLHVAVQKGQENVAIKLVKASPSLLPLADMENSLPLHYATLKYLPNAVKEILNQSGDKNVDHRDKSGETPLTLALKSLAKDSETEEKTKMMIIKLLVGHGADLTQRLYWSKQDSLPVLHHLVRQGRRDVLREVKTPWEVIINMRYEPQAGTLGSRSSTQQIPFGATPLYVAATAGSLKSVKFLLEKGADPNIGLSTGSSNEPPTPLWVALNKSHTDVAKALLKHDAKIDVEWQGSHMLHFAIEKTSAQCRTEVVKLLLSHNANLHQKDSSKRIPLIFAAEKGCISSLNALWDAHAKLELPETHAMDALKAICREGHHCCVALLYAKGADINTQDEHGYTPLHYAASYNRTDVINVLLSMGADRTVKAQTRQEPFEVAGTAEAVARASGHVDTAGLIKNWGQ
ncbi:hypothetical protein PFICI_00007 [Pestalotiopsis fici W106-1]|uniref:Uncharacterized protein n=1 Tax=Pestalotiopsis fici (strain W106-1 / CGMCC3.15140) TaxID=1229662 RepID=W3XJI6_PESFW|nr:uncharacterized protein PFICI_00007 [Pestalotiopsis fici W106-1]ETS86179.1 hypothetical protein PFICI_00007 [Pestalotiopsis fici W106-1]